MLVIRVIGPLSALAFAALTAAVRVPGADSEPARRACDPGNGGLTLPDGFCATVFADGVGGARHLVVAPNGDVFVALRGSRRRGTPGGILALRDTDGDGRADVRHRFEDGGGTGIALHDGHLYFGRDDAIVRYRLRAGALEAAAPPDTIVSGLPDTGSHRAKSIVITDDGRLFVNIGSPSNACQRDRTPGSPGMDPCTELETRAGIWLFEARRTNQRQQGGRRYATGLRNTVALALDPAKEGLYGVVHGRDRLSASWPALYTEAENAELPSEKLVRIEEGDDFGWPYCYHDPELGRLVLAPEYGGDGRRAGRCANKKGPLAAYPAHWAPNGLLFYSGTNFPERYREGAFIAFHGSWNRAPLPQAGYKVVFQPFENGVPAGEFETFADGFAGGDRSPRGADHRPVGLAQGPSGELYISDDSGGRIWRVVHVGG